MLSTQAQLPDAQSPLGERLGLGILALVPVQFSQVVERVGHVEMLGSQLLLEDSQGLLAERFGCSYLP